MPVVGVSELAPQSPSLLQQFKVRFFYLKLIEKHMSRQTNEFRRTAVQKFARVE